MKEISLCLIVKNEEKVLARCLESMKGCYDELIIVDTESTDKTVEIAKSFGARVETFKWIDDFGAARNHAFSFATKPWVMWCDADDILEPGKAEEFRKIVTQYDDDEKITGINFPYIYSHESTGTGEMPDFKYHRLRIIKRGTGFWKARIHEYIHHPLDQQVNIQSVPFHHYRDEGRGTQNTARNLRILKKVVDDATPEDKPRYLFYYGKECMYNGLWDDAEKAFKEYIPLSNWLPEKHRAMYELAVCYQRKNDIENCRRYAFEAITLDQRYSDPYVLLATVAYNEKDWKMCAAWASMVPKLEKPETFFFDYIPYNTYVPWDFMAVSYWHFDHVKGKEAILKCLEYKPLDRRFLFNWTQFYSNEKICIVIPTHTREKQLLNCLDKIANNTILTNFEIRIGVDGNEEYYNSLKEKLKQYSNVFVTLFPKAGVPIIVEKLIDSTDAKYIAYIGDDCAPRDGWLIHALIACDDKNLVCFNDRVWNGEVACHWFAPKDLRKELGGFFFYAGYHHVGCDNEMTDKAKRLGKYVFAKNALVDHIHAIQNICTDKNKVAEWDDTYRSGWHPLHVESDRQLLERRKANNYISDSDIIKVNLGCGSLLKEGYVNIDKYGAADIQADAFRPGLFAKNSINKFLLEHFLEHFTEQEGSELLQICWKALKKDGEIEIAVPDMELVQQVPDLDYRVKVMYGWQLDGMRHKFGFTVDTLSKLLLRHGFDVANVERGFEYDAPSIRVRAIRKE